MTSLCIKMLIRLAAAFLVLTTSLFISATTATASDGGGYSRNTLDHPNPVLQTLLLPPDIDPAKLTYKVAFYWPQGYCKTKGSGCKKVTNLPKYFTMHGLWPIYRAMCNDSTTKFNISDVRDIKGNLEKNWPDLKNYGNPIKYEKFWVHEWEAHGTRCGLYTVLGYFSRSLKLLADSNVLQVLENAGKPTKPEDVKKAFTGKEPYVRCKLGSDNKLYFYQLEFCLDSSENYYNCPKKSEKSQCPEGQHFSYGDTTTTAFFTEKLKNHIDSMPLSM